MPESDRAEGSTETWPGRSSCCHGETAFFFCCLIQGFLHIHVSIVTVQPAPAVAAEPQRVTLQLRADGCYEGALLQGRRHGRGLMRWNPGRGKIVVTAKDYRSREASYEGDWVDDVPHGSGVMLFENGDRYQGNFVMGHAEGQGSKTWAQPPRAGDSYQGQWRADMRHGQGEMRWSAGDRYKGQWRDGMRHGQGEHHWADGQWYKGEWLDDKMHGQGEYHLPDGRWYKGEWRDYKMHGQGEYHWPKGGWYKGEWRDAKMHGQGEHHAADGKVSRGRWDNDKFVG